MKLLEIFGLVSRNDYDYLDSCLDDLHNHNNELIAENVELRNDNEGLYMATVCVTAELFKYQMFGIPLAIVAGMAIGWWF